MWVKCVFCAFLFHFFFFTADKIEGAVLCNEGMIMADIQSLPASCTDCSSHCPPRRVHPGTHSVGNQCSVTFQHKHSFQKTVQRIRSSCALLVLERRIRTINSSFGEGKVNATSCKEEVQYCEELEPLFLTKQWFKKKKKKKEQKQANKTKRFRPKKRQLRLLWRY